MKFPFNTRDREVLGFSMRDNGDSNDSAPRPGATWPIFASLVAYALEILNPSAVSANRRDVDSGGCSAGSSRDLTACAIRNRPALGFLRVAVRTTLVAGWVLFSGICSAQTITYTLQGTASGNLVRNGSSVPFSNAAYSFSVVTDAATIIPDGSSDGGFYTTWTTRGAVSIDGVTGTFSNGVMVEVYHNGSSSWISLAQQLNASSYFYFLTGYSGSLAAYDLQSHIGPLSLNSPAPNAFSPSIATSFGSFTLTSVSTASFTATLSPPSQSFTIAFYGFVGQGSGLAANISDYTKIFTGTFQIASSALGIPNNLILYRDPAFLSFDASFTTSIRTYDFNLNNPAVRFPGDPLSVNGGTRTDRLQGLRLDASGAPLRFDTPSTLFSNSAEIRVVVPSTNPLFPNGVLATQNMAFIDDDTFDFVMIADGTILRRAALLGRTPVATFAGFWTFFESAVIAANDYSGIYLIAPAGNVIPISVGSHTAQFSNALVLADRTSVNTEQPVGTATEVSGKATLFHKDGSQEIISVGTPIRVGDTIETEQDGRINVHFVDSTDFSVSPNARLPIDEYVYDPKADDSSNASLLREIFIWTSKLMSGKQIQQPPVGGGGDLRGDAAPYINKDYLDPAVKMNVGSSVSLVAPIPRVQAPGSMSFDYLFLTPTGTLDVFLGDVLLFSTTAAEHPVNVFQRADFNLPPISSLPSDTAKLTFLVDGPHGSSLLLDNVIFPGLQNGDFSQFDNGWFWVGPGQLELVATISEDRYADLLQKLGDTTPPITAPSVSPGPNANGWNNSDVTVTLTASDNPGGSGVKEVHYALSGAQTGGAIVAGSSSIFSVSTEGITTITFFSIDNQGNTEATGSLTVKLDKTPPVIHSTRDPGPNANGWNNTNVTVNFQCADNFSGLAPGSPPVSTLLTSEAAAQSVTRSCSDLAGNSAVAAVSGINIDKTAPVITVQASPTMLWPSDGKMVPVTISGTMTDTLSGIDPGMASFVVRDSYGALQPHGPVSLTLDGAFSFTVLLEARRDGQDVNGRQYAVSVAAQDKAGNVNSASTLVLVPHDQGNR